MEVLAAARSSLRFPARCLGCDNLPQVSWRIGGGLLRRGKLAVPVCRACRRRLWAARWLLRIAAGLLGVTVGDLLGGESAVWVLSMLGCLLLSTWVGGKPAAQLARLGVDHATPEVVHLAFSDPVLAAQVAALSGGADPYRGGAAAMAPSRPRNEAAWVVGLACLLLTLLAAAMGRWGVACIFALPVLGLVINIIIHAARRTRFNQPVSSLWRRKRI